MAVHPADLLVDLLVVPRAGHPAAIRVVLLVAPVRAMVDHHPVDVLIPVAVVIVAKADTEARGDTEAAATVVIEMDHLDDGHRAIAANTQIEMTIEIRIEIPSGTKLGKRETATSH